MNPTLDDLRHVLQDEADASAAPSADALVAGATARVQAARRRRAVLAGVAAVLVLAGGLLAGTHSGRNSSEPARTGPFRVDATGAGFPPYSNGEKRMLVVTAPAQQVLKGTVRVQTTPGSPLSVRMACLPLSVTDWATRVAASVTGPDGSTRNAFCGTPQSWMGATGLGTAGTTRATVALDLFINHEGFTPGSGPSFKDATVSLAFYQPVPWADYRFPERPANVEANPDLAWQPTQPGSTVAGPKLAAQANSPLTVDVPFTKARVIQLDVHGPGRAKVTVNGLPLDFGPSLPDLLRIEDGWAEFFEYLTGEGASTVLDPRTPFGRSVLGRGQPVRITVTPEGFAGPDWRLVVAPRSCVPGC